MIERLNGRTSIILSAAGLLAVVLVGWFGFLSPQRQKAADLAEQIRQTELQLTATEALIRGSALEQSGKELARLRTVIPDEVSMPQIMRQLSRASAESRVRILGITPEPVVANGVADAVPISVTVEGRYFGIREFLRLLRTRAALKGEQVQATGRLFSISSIQFAGGSSENGLINATLAVNAYAFRGPAPAPGASTAGTDEDPAAEASGG